MPITAVMANQPTRFSQSKNPQDTDLYQINFGSFLGQTPTDTIISNPLPGIVIRRSDGTTNDLLLRNLAVNSAPVPQRGIIYAASSLVSMWLFGGTNGIDYTISISITTAMGRSATRSALLHVAGPSFLMNNVGILYVSDPTWPTTGFQLGAGAFWSNGGVVSIATSVPPNPAAPPIYLDQMTSKQLLAYGGGNLPIIRPPLGSNQLWNYGGIGAVA